MSETRWPEPVPDPEVERGESENGLLPSADEIANMDADELENLLELVEKWEGPLVDKFREAVAKRLERGGRRHES